MNRNLVLLVLCLVISVTAVSYSQVASLPKRWTEAEQVISKYVDANDVYLASQTAQAAASHTADAAALATHIFATQSAHGIATEVRTTNASITSTLDVGDVNATRADITNASVATGLSVGGYSSFGDTTTPIKIATYSLVLSSTEGTSITVAHGIDATKVVMVSAVTASTTDGVYHIPPSFANTGGAADKYRYSVFLDATNIYGATDAVNASCAGVLGYGIKIFVVYRK
jgi:hypothetical protein